MTAVRSIRNHYLDESGNTGDLISAGDALDFAKQRIFALACVGVDSLEDLSLELERLKRVHRIQSPELKSTALRNKPRFTKDLLEYLNHRDLPIMIEIVDKRFLICATMVNHLIFPPVCPADLEPLAIYVRQKFADYLGDYMPDAIISAYIGACEARSPDAVARTYDLLDAWLGDCCHHDEVAAGLKHATEESRVEFETDVNLKICDRLPVPDPGKACNSFWILPNLSSFTNIYARLNRAHDREVEKLKLFHDEQLQFDEIIRAGGVAAEKLASISSVPELPCADYHFTQSARLEFVPSVNNAGIQAADVLAGFATRYVQKALATSMPMEEPFRTTFRMLMRFDEGRATGCNLLMSPASVNRLIRGE